jgi:SAM-dependent methyltransferase
LLRAEARKNAREVDGYLALRATDLDSTGPAQDLMLSRIVPRVYERWWRPGLGRMVKGLFGPGMAEEYRIARSLLSIAPGDGVLDVACGPGNFTREFARAVGETGLVVGIDASRTMLAQAAADERNADVDNLAFVFGDAVELPFRLNSFDAVCCFAALHLFADPMRALDRIRAVLTPGGRIAIFTSSRSRYAPLRAIESLIGRSSGMRMFEQDEITNALEARGFVDIRQRLAGFTQFVGGRLAAKG